MPSFSLNDKDDVLILIFLSLLFFIVKMIFSSEKKFIVTSFGIRFVSFSWGTLKSFFEGFNYYIRSM